MAALDPAYEPSFEQIEQIRDLAAGRGQPTTSGSHAPARPSANARRPSAPIGPRLLAEPLVEGLLIRRGAAPVRTDMPQLDTDRAVLMPGDPPTLRLPIGPGWACVIQAEPPAEPSPWWAQLDRAALGEGLLLRRRRAGDRFRPVGGRGSRKLQDFFVDAKLPRQLRDAWPILTTETAIVWVVGLRADARFVAGPASQDTIWVGLVRE